MPYVRSKTPMRNPIPAATLARIQSRIPPAVFAKLQAMLKLPAYARSHDLGAYEAVARVPGYWPSQDVGLGCGPGCTACAGCRSGLGFTMPTDWGLTSSSIATSFGIQPFATSYPVIGTSIPNWAFYLIGGAIALSMFKGRR